MERRIRIVGCPGSGKSTLAAELARRHGLVHIELDALFHMPNWEARPVNEFQAEVRARIAAAERGWVLDGNYGSKLGGLFDDEADVIVWLDLPRHLVMRRLAWRSVYRAVTGKELWNGNRERLANLLKWHPEDNILRWAWVRHPVYRTRYAEKARGVWKHKALYRLTSPRQVARFQESFQPRGG